MFDVTDNKFNLFVKYLPIIDKHFCKTIYDSKN